MIGAVIASSQKIPAASLWITAVIGGHSLHHGRDGGRDRLVNLENTHHGRGKFSSSSITGVMEAVISSSRLGEANHGRDQLKMALDETITPTITGVIEDVLPSCKHHGRDSNSGSNSPVHHGRDEPRQRVSFDFSLIKLVSCVSRAHICNSRASHMLYYSTLLVKTTLNTTQHNSHPS